MALPLPFAYNWRMIPVASAPFLADGHAGSCRHGYYVVLLYENMAAGKRAYTFCEKLIDELGARGRCEKGLWSFKVLDLDHIRQEAEAAATRADVVILSLDGEDELPRSFKNWLENWPRRAGDKSPTVVALFGSPESDSARLTETRAYLRSATKAAGLTFAHSLS